MLRADAPRIRGFFSRRSIGIFVLWVVLFPIVARASEVVRPAAPSRTYAVAEVLSGDTFRLETGTIVAYSSVLAPPLADPDPGVREYAKRSADFNRSLLQGRRVRIEFGSQIKNSDGIYQGFVFLEDGTLANLKIIEAGYAKLHIAPPNLQYAEELRHASFRARHDGAGLWQMENAKDRRFVFIADQMTRKFHFAGCARLKGVSPAHLERFESTLDAKAAGYTFCPECRHTFSQETDLF